MPYPRSRFMNRIPICHLAVHSSSKTNFPSYICSILKSISEQLVPTPLSCLRAQYPIRRTHLYPAGAHHRSHHVPPLQLPNPHNFQIPALSRSSQAKPSNPSTYVSYTSTDAPPPPPPTPPPTPTPTAHPPSQTPASSYADTPTSNTDPPNPTPGRRLVSRD